ncbi:MAG: hypothetical protein Q4A07_01315 [Coriobacteriales bacterium]|nr:hypothetical protein [Coriobacteriales bacterium]
MFEGPISPDGFTPLPKNPLIASFFSNIGLAEELGSGTRNLFRYSPRYSGKDPVLLEGTVFKATVAMAVGNGRARKYVLSGTAGPMRD